MKVEVAVLGSLTLNLIVRTASMDVKQHRRTEPGICVKVEVVVLNPQKSVRSLWT